MPSKLDQANPPALRLEGVDVTYSTWLGLRRLEILRGIDLRVDAGCVLGLVGPNGSGKSTLLRTLAGLERCRGVLRVLDGSPGRSAVRARIGFLGEDSAFPEELSARAALELIASLTGLSRSERRTRVPEWLARVGLSPVSRKRLGGFSRGMRRRFGLAQAALHRPDLLLLDEPTAGLDAEGYEVLEELLRETRARGATTVLCSHAPDDLVQWCDEVAILFEGRIVARGAPSEVLPQEGLVALYRQLRREPSA